MAWQLRPSPSPLSRRETLKLDYPLRFISGGLFLLMAIQALLDSDPLVRQQTLLVMAGSLAYALIGFTFFYNRWHRSFWQDMANGLFDGVMIALLTGHLPRLGLIAFSMVGLATLIYIASRSGRWPAMLFLVTWLGLFPLMPAYQLLKIVIVDYLRTYHDFANPIRSADLWSLALLGGIGLVASETVLFWRQLTARSVQRLQAINAVSRRLMGTLEYQELLDEINQVMQNAIPADSYFLGILQGEELALDILYDHGRIYPPLRLKASEGLAGWVLSRRQTLLLTDVLAQMDALGIKRRLVGSDQPNLSWLGTPMIFGDHLVGILAAGSYRRNAFDEADQEMLESLAQLVAAALVNARHHAEIETQARHDSLTGALNHGAVIAGMEAWAQAGTPFSVIMLDVDFFKQYNDTYGHQAGDLILCEIVRIIRSHLKASDLVGRWGGEEFAIGLQNTSLEQAFVVAERIRTTLQAHRLTLPGGATIPAPTVSQGLAHFPSEAQDVFQLVSLADQRLYKAKEGGRNAIWHV